MPTSRAGRRTTLWLITSLRFLGEIMSIVLFFRLSIENLTKDVTHHIS